MIGKYKNIKLSLDKKYPHQELSFDRIQFKNVYFKHKNTETMVFENFNLDLDVDDNKIIGITGPSGRGKSSLIKLLLRLHDPDSGSITFDDIPIDIIDPNYIRSHITYISQNSKLFDRNILDNILYSCDISELDVCKYNLELILKNKKFKKLFNNNGDFLNIKSGFLGENLSGGQRQFINILSGLVNPSKILILDEPTNAVDYELKSQIIRIIKTFKYYKKSIIIISHDKDIFPLFDININL
jgi:ABC-type bacteriocin/lantibiotic exporter with double-glycine peptidase domain